MHAMKNLNIECSAQNAPVKQLDKQVQYSIISCIQMGQCNAFNIGYTWLQE